MHLRKANLANGCLVSDPTQPSATAMTVDRGHSTATSQLAPSSSSSSTSSSSSSSRSSKSPPSSSAFTPAASGAGVFLPNCKLSADFLQLRTDHRTPPRPVRLHLTTTELVVRKPTSTSAAASADEYSLLRYPLQDIDVGRSLVSPRTIVVSVKTPPKENGAPQEAWKSRSNGENACGCGSHVHCRENVDGELPTVTCDACKCSGTGSARKGGCRVVLVEAYQLPPDQGAVEEWLSCVERSKQKISLLSRKSSCPQNLGVTAPSIPQPSSQPSSRPTSRPTSLRGRKRRSLVFSNSQCTDALYTSASSPSSPARERRLRAALYHNTQHPLKATSPLSLPRNITTSVTQQHTDRDRERDSRRLFRRFSLGGSPILPPRSGKSASQGEPSQDVETEDIKGLAYRMRHDVCTAETTIKPSASNQTNIASTHSSPLLRRPGMRARNFQEYLVTKQRPSLPRSHSYDPGAKEKCLPNGHLPTQPVATEPGSPPELEHIKNLISSLPVPLAHSPTSTPPSLSPSPSSESEGFHSLLRHKQFRGQKWHVSPRALGVTASARSSVTSPPGWGDKSSGKLSPGRSFTMPRSKKKSNSLSKETADTEGTNSPLPKRSKTPKLFRKLHRRWQSSSGVKLELDMMGESSIPPEKLYTLPPKDIAEGLTGMDAELLERISPEEICDGAWMKREEKDKLAPNILAMVHAFNQLALLVPTEILEERTHQQRAKVITVYIQIASKCYSLKNYNSLKAILAGLQCTPIFRLKKTWKEVPSKRRKRFNQLCKLMSEDDNWQLYRNELDSCLAASAPCVPYLGQFLTQVCHQLSYAKMKAEKKDVEMKRRSNSFDNLSSLAESRDKMLRRRSSSFQHEPQQVNEGKRASVISVSAPTSPLASDDEEEEEESTGTSGVRIHQMQAGTRSRGRISFSCSVEETAREPPLKHGFVEHQTRLDTSESSIDSKSGTRDGDKSTRQGLKLQSTPIKSINGYVRSSHPPFDPDISFSEAPLNQGFDETDLGNDPLSNNVSVESSTVNGDPPVHARIPSISLQRNSSQSSLEGEGDEVETGRFKKSHSVESSLNKRMANGSDTDVHGIMAPLNQLSVSQSIHSLDSDSVFSIDDREDEEEDEEEEEEEEEDTRQEDDSMLGFALELDLNDVSSQPMDSLTHSLPLTALTPQPQDNTLADKNSPVDHGGICSVSLEQGHPDDPQLQHVVRRSKSVGSATARHKWRRKKPSVLVPPVPPSQHGITDPYKLLGLFQTLSRECYPSSVCKVDFKTLLSKYSQNSETRNYELSFEREP